MKKHVQVSATNYLFPDERTPGKLDLTGAQHRNALLGLASKLARLGYFEINPDTHEMKWSRQLINIFELEKSFNILEGQQSNYFFKEEYPLVLQAFRDALEGKYRSITYRIQTTSGKIKILRTIFSGPGKGRNDAPVFGTTQDITEIKGKQVEIINREKELRSITESAPILIMKTNLAQEVQYVNKRELQYLVGNNVCALFGQDYYREIKEKMGLALRTYQPVSFEAKVGSADEPVWYSGTVKRINYTGEAPSLILLLEDISDSKRMEHTMFKAISIAEEKERSRIAEQLHDGVCQTLSTVQLLFTTMEERLQANEDTGDLIPAIKQLVKESLSMTRDLSHELMPPLFSELGFSSALLSLVSTLNLAGGIKYKLRVDGKENNAYPELFINLYRIIQEFISNSQKHSRATEIEIFVSYGTDRIQMRISDNGIGFNPNHIKSKKGIGLYTMVKRVSIFNGTHSYQTAKGEGTRLHVSVPWPA